MKEIKKVSIKNGLKLIADSCHALGGTMRRLLSCKYEHLSTFSFILSKQLLQLWGAVTTNNKKLASAMRLMRSHNVIRTKSNDRKWEYTVRDLGYNYRLSDIQCALGVNQLKKIHYFRKKRSELVAFYNSKLRKFCPKIITPQPISSSDPESVCWHLYSILVDFKAIRLSKGNFVEKLSQKKIYTQVHYIPVHTQPYYKNLYGKSFLPGSEQYYERTISLPLFTKMSEDDVD